MRLLAKLDCGWSLYVDPATRRARPYLVAKDGRVRTPFEAARCPEGKKIWLDIDAVWRVARVQYQGPWRHDPRWRAIDYARDAVMIELQFQRRWDPDLMQPLTQTHRRKAA